jgi:DNA-binding NarL/FixJ family response regulator
MRPVPGIGDLIRREREVVALIAAALSNGEIARKLYVSRSTAKARVVRARPKLGACHRVELAGCVYQAGLATSP